MGFEVNEKRGYDAEPAASLKPMEMPVKEEK